MKLFDKVKNKENHEWIKYVYHTLKFSQKEEFITLLVAEDVVFAAQCQVSDAYNANLEEIVFDYSFKLANDFSDKDKSRNGLLALVELKKYDVIQSLFNNTNRPVKDLNLILSTIFSSVDESNFIKFLDILSEYEDLNSTLTALLAYTGEISLSVHSKPVIKKFIHRLLDDGWCGFLRIFADHFDLWRDFEYYADIEPAVLIGRLNTKGISEVSFAVELALQKDILSSELSRPSVLLTDEMANEMISTVIKNYGYGEGVKTTKKGIRLALRIANAKGIYNNDLLNNYLQDLLSSTEKTFTDIVFKIRKAGLYEYAENVPRLFHLLKMVPGYKKYKARRSEHFKPVTKKIDNGFEITTSSQQFKKIFSSILDTKATLKINSEYEYWDLFFKYSFAHSPMPYIHEYLNIFLHAYGTGITPTDLRELCRTLKLFNHEGIVKSISELGAYVYPLTFRSKNLLFLHSSHIAIDLPVGMGIDSIIGQEIDFRIIGFKPEPNKRINISMLSDEEIDLQMLNKTRGI